MYPHVGALFLRSETVFIHLTSVQLYDWNDTPWLSKF